MFRRIIYCASLLLVISNVYAQDEISTERWNIHFQQTVIVQYHFDFHSPYSGVNSLEAHEPSAHSLTATLFLGKSLWEGAELYLNPEIAGGSGLSGSVGVAGALNGETYRIGDAAPSLVLARCYLKQSIGFSRERDTIRDDANQLQKVRASKRLDITMGKYSIADLFDGNNVSHDPRSQFINWSLMSAGAWDYPADTKGYTIGATIEYITPEFSLRGSLNTVPIEANLGVFDKDISNAHSETIECELPHHLFSYQGSVRFLVFHTNARMGNYDEAVAKAALRGGVPDITNTRTIGNSKFGFSVNLEQQLSRSLNSFFRASWNDGKNETWMFTEIDHSVSGGVAVHGIINDFPEDHIRAAFVVNGISTAHQRYIAAGGSGFILGDGALSYASELVLEAQYSARLNNFLSAAFDYQFVVNPGYNHDRGPVSAIAFRAHVEI